MKDDDMGKLPNALQGHTLITYADDSYVVISADELEDLKRKVKAVSTTHSNFLRKIGMIVNAEKTELVIFQKELVEENFEFDGKLIKSKSAMKALGITFQHNLKWDIHVQNVVSKISPKLTVLKSSRKNMTTDQFLTVATSQLFSIMYYGSQVWMNSTLTSDLWKKLKAIHYKILRVANRDYRNRISKRTLDLKHKRATPKMWSDYATTSLVIKVFRDRCPEYLYENLKTTCYQTRRMPQAGRFFDNSKGKIGKHRLGSRLAMMDGLQWYDKNWNNDQIRIRLKEHFDFDFKRTIF